MVAQASGGRSGAWSITASTIVLAGIGAALYAVANWTTLHVLVPGTENIDIRPQYGLVTFFGFAFGPVVGFLVGFVGNTVGDQLSYQNAFGSWWWSVANGLAGLFCGLAAMLVRPTSSTTTRALIGAIAGLVATIVAFSFIGIEMIIQDFTLQRILNEEYIPTVIANSAVALLATPILVLAWEPLREQLRASSTDPMWTGRG
jgi:energy-coupling factor transport system substrate-specific component